MNSVVVVLASMNSEIVVVVVVLCRVIVLLNFCKCSFHIRFVDVGTFIVHLLEALIF